jgi:hypothetical protein
MKAMGLAVAQKIVAIIAVTLIAPLVSEAGSASGLCCERSLQAYDGVANVVGNPNPVISGFPKPCQRGGSKGCLRRLHFMRPFAPCFGRLVAGAQVYLLIAGCEHDC